MSSGRTSELRAPVACASRLRRQRRSGNAAPRHLHRIGSDDGARGMRSARRLGSRDWREPALGVAEVCSALAGSMHQRAGSEARGSREMALSSTHGRPRRWNRPASSAARPLRHTFVDLGMSPLCQRHVRPAELNQMEPFYPLHVRVCEQCFLVQLEEYVSPQEIFNDYAYFSSFSAPCSRMPRFTADPCATDRASATTASWSRSPATTAICCSISSARRSACSASSRRRTSPRRPIAKGIPTRRRVLRRGAGAAPGAEGATADLIVGNNVLAHVPDINDFVGGHEGRCSSPTA